MRPVRFDSCGIMEPLFQRLLYGSLPYTAKPLILTSAHFSRRRFAASPNERPGLRGVNRGFAGSSPGFAGSQGYRGVKVKRLSRAQTWLNGKFVGQFTI